ncbi:siroheme synthase CysG [Devosia sp.]|uniref:siroheme synthase CysG n=1 Tax=Devosia sp. TaxID=1871048 RepID=UPI0032646245
MHIVSPQPSSTQPDRMAALACLPVFFTLTGQRAVVAGGSEPARWKAELLAAAGAIVDVICPRAECSQDMLDLIVQSPRRSLTLIDRHWTAEDLTGAALAIADIEDEAEALAFCAAAKAAGVPYNVIDKPAFCQFQFGTIVNRSPVVVGISTNGAAPILGQAVRRRIETLLPQTLALWAGLARDLRDTVMEKLNAGPQRRAFWENLADRAFGDTAPAADDTVETMIRAASKAQPGRVTLVGAGPGDAELLTVKAIRALQSADVILFDDLVSPEVLELARREARRMLVGKRAARESCKQDDINAMMLSLARQGKHVVRLKSGDPMIFGRAGEEIEMLQANGIAVTVVPGVTAALALASRLGVSLTHRDHAQSVRFVTGHSRKGELPTTLNWQALADAATTSVYYMSRRTLPGIVASLKAQGMSGTTPAIIAGNIGRQDEQIWRGTVDEAVSAVLDFPLSAPTIFAVGDALGLAQSIQKSGASPRPLRDLEVLAQPQTAPVEWFEPNKDCNSASSRIAG